MSNWQKSWAEAKIPCRIAGFNWALPPPFLESRQSWALFNPSRMYPDDYAKGLDQFLQYVYSASMGGPGAKVLGIQELWQWSDARNMPRGFRLCCQAGREHGIQLLLDTQEPHRINSSILGQTTELVCFRLQEPKAWDCIRELGMDVDKVKNLPLGQFISLNRLSGGTLQGKLF
jgi:hypothetical protein